MIEKERDINGIKTSIIELKNVQSFDETVEANKVRRDNKFSFGSFHTVKILFDQLKIDGIMFPNELAKDLELLLMKTKQQYREVGWIGKIDVEELKRIIDEILKITNEQIT